MIAVMGRIRAIPHRGKEQTGRFMYGYAEHFCDDIPGLERTPFPVWYARVKAIPYRSDEDLFPEDPNQIIEVVARPAYLVNPNIFPRLDCKKKAILIGAWAAANHRPFCFLAVSEIPSGEIHHVFPAVDFGSGWRTADATLPEFRVGQVFPITYAEELLR